MGIYIQKFGKLGQRYFKPDEIEYSPHSGDCIKVLNKQNGKEKTYVVINEDVGDLRLHTRELMPRVHYTICDENIWIIFICLVFQLCLIKKGGYCVYMIRLVLKENEMEYIRLSIH